MEIDKLYKIVKITSLIIIAISIGNISFQFGDLIQALRNIATMLSNR
ncbi:hypothetical protein DFP93_102136 [Aneurinibacillus soli]|uniref:Uncharacterized protein n=1 Tax=Aneurinibacillus soli TaxID=1500254 RepID=A0A0U5B047_9BACL|nr:hypothetical protein DFP93_102136 [Aneurinibacillus soli]BAU27616.1 hypothetical protein CB4_01790 [Aneurinibacillus soli]